MYKINLTDQSQTIQNPDASAHFGNLRGGGQRFNFGGINDSPAGKWVWLGLAAVAAVAGLFLYFTKGKSK